MPKYFLLIRICLTTMLLLGAALPNRAAPPLYKVPFYSATITTTPADASSPVDAFDGSDTSWMRSANVNPAFVQFEFDSPIAVSKLRVFLGEIDFSGDVNTWLWEAADSASDLAQKTGTYQTGSDGARVAGNWDEATLATPLSRRIWRFTVQRIVGDNYVYIDELELWSEQFIAAPSYQVRSAYVIPANRAPQPNGVSQMQNALQLYQSWYRDQMERYGFGPKTFEFETETDGVTPKIHVVYAASDTIPGEDTWNKWRSAALQAGLPIQSPKQVWWIVAESHIQLPNSGLTNQFFGGAGGGSGDDGGLGLVSGDALARLDPNLWVDDTPYEGQSLTTIGPYPLVENLTFAWFEGTTFSSVSSAVVGGALHEISHGFGLFHDFRNDNNFNGNLMGNGLRGMRGNLFPARYPNDYINLSYGAALGLNVSRYFNSHVSFTDSEQPSLTSTSGGSVDPENGLIPIHFFAGDNSGLSAAWLIRNGELIDEMPLAGQSTNAKFFTPSYTPGQGTPYSVIVFDLEGNRATLQVSIVPSTAFNSAPLPFVTFASPTIPVGGTTTLDASGSTDPDGDSGLMQVEWDLNGDGQFDTSPTTNKIFNAHFTLPGNWLIRARLTDSAGNQSRSTPMALRVVPAPVIGRYVFYNHSSFDGYDPGASPADDAAIATDKTPLLPGNAATFQNYTSYTAGINGIMIDVAGLPDLPNASDFLFKVGNSSQPADWEDTLPPTSITLRRSAGAAGSDRITCLWPDHSIQGRWLQVTVKASPRTGLAAADVFYFGNAIGECGNDPTSAIVNVTDVALTRLHPRSPLSPAPVDFVYDYNRDGLVDVTDVAVSRAHQTSPLTALQMIHVP